jgi:sugar (pentulose or hexulose) kinase
VACVRDLLRDAEKKGLNPSHVVSIGVCGQGDGLWALDADNEPVGNAILWNDQRAATQVQSWIDDGTAATLSKICGTANWPGSSGSLFQWLQQHDAKSAASIRCILNCKDWINYKLTGALGTDYTEATIPFTELRSRQYNSEAFKLLDSTALEQRLLSPQASTRKTGDLLSDSASLLGLPCSIPVAIGTLDIAAMMIGLGLQSPGDVSVILGTTAVVSMIVEPHVLDREVTGATLLHPYLPHWIRVLAPQSGCSALDWFIEQHPNSIKSSDPVRSAENLCSVALSSAAGANGVLFLPFLAGERAPFVAPLASASFLNLRTNSTRSDMARGVLEGVAYSLRQCFESADITSAGSVFVTGGGARSPLWCDILASVLNSTVRASDASDHGLKGAALLGAAAAGHDASGIVGENALSARTHLPNSDWIDVYDRQFNQYIDCVDHARNMWPSLSQAG